MQHDPGMLRLPQLDVGVSVSVMVAQLHAESSTRVGLGDALEEVDELGLADPA